MPISNGTFARIWKFVDRFTTSDAVARADLDAACDDLAGGVNGALSEALQAKNASFSAADVYDDTAAGLAATSVGGQFMVVVGTEIVRYRHDTGPVATEVARYGGTVTPRGFVLLGTADLTGESTVTISDLDLTDYTLLYLAVKLAQGGSGDQVIGTGPGEFGTASPSLPQTRMALIDLSDGELLQSGDTLALSNVATGITNASTSVSISIASGTWSQGTLKVWGVR